MTYAQRGEDDFLAPLLPGRGRYLEIGAYDGRTFSNSRLFAERGWEGVCVEPAAHPFALMATDPPPGATLVNAMIGRTRGLTSFYYSRDAVSTTEDGHARTWAGVANYIPTFVASVTVDDLLERFPGPYDLISVDCEGTTSQIVEDLLPRLDALKVRALVFEHDGSSLDIPGFREGLRTQENSVMLR